MHRKEKKLELYKLTSRQKKVIALEFFSKFSLSKKHINSLTIYCEVAHDFSFIVSEGSVQENRYMK